MTITKIKKIGNKNYYHIYADEKWVGVFLDEILVKYSIKTNSTFDEAAFSKIKEENDEKVSFDMAVGYLEKYSVSEKGLRDYLKKKGFGGKTIKKSVEKLREYGFLDDEKFAKNYFETLSSKNGKRAIATKLKQKGVSAEIIENLLSGVEEDDEIQNATLLAEKFAKNRQKDLKNKQKCLAHLIYKGYDYGVAQKVTNKIFTGEEDDWV